MRFNLLARMLRMAPLGCAMGFGLISVATLAEEAPTAAKNEVSGIVKVVGSAYNAKTVLTNSDGKEQKSLCRDETGKKINRLSGMTVTAAGTWDNKNQNDPCFPVSSFQIDKTTSGRKPLVGTLTKAGADFVLIDDDGAKHPLERVSSGLKEMLGRKVIVDVKPLAKAAGAQSWKVVSYSEYP